MYTIPFFCLSFLTVLQICATIDSPTGAGQKTEECSENCFDYNRVCPGFKDASIFDKISRDKENGNHLKIPKNLPWPPNCEDPFYQLACPRSCSVCIPCEKKAGVVCANECTHQVVVRNEQEVCEEKIELTEYVEDPCPCYCGEGTTVARRQCVWFEGTSSSDCKVKTATDDSVDHPCGKNSLNIQKSCNNQNCTINKVVVKTYTETWSGSGNTFDHTAYTKGGDACDLGQLDDPNKTERIKGSTDTHNIEMECSACMAAADEVFDYVNIKVNGDDGWKGEISVTVNGNEQRYWNNKWLDDSLTQRYNKK